MNPETDQDEYSPVSADERWIDAALSEHARLGHRSDEELVFRILQETVHRGDRVRPVRAATRDWKPFVVAAGSVAASVAVALFVISQRGPSSSERRSDELRFVVRVASPETNAANTTSGTPPRVAAIRHTGPIEVNTPASPTAPVSPVLAAGQLEWVTEFGPSFSPLPRTALRGERLRISADRGESSGSGMVYEGDVLVEHDLFRIEASRVKLPASGATEAPLLAYHVRVEQPKSDCVAEAETLRFDPTTGRLVLTGVTRVKTDRGELGRFAPGDRLVLSGNGFSVETAPVERSASPLPLTR